MKVFTPYLLKFILVAAGLTVLFRSVLSYGIESRTAPIIILAAIFYGLALFASGWYFGVRDARYLPIYDIGFRLHLATYIVHISISELWFVLRFKSGYEQLETVHWTAVYWGILLFIHFLFFLSARKRSISGLDKTDLFE